MKKCNLFETEYTIDAQVDLRCVKFDKKKHVEALYTLMSKRKNSISHSQIPSEVEHKRFCLAHPYRAWYLIIQNLKFIGAFYITSQNTIGINIIEETEYHHKAVFEFILKTFDPLPPVPSIVSKYFHCNISPSDTHLIDVLKNLNGELSQITYVLKKMPVD